MRVALAVWVASRLACAQARARLQGVRKHTLDARRKTSVGGAGVGRESPTPGLHRDSETSEVATLVVRLSQPKGAEGQQPTMRCTKKAPRRAAPPSRAEAAAAKNRGTLRRIQGANPRIYAWSRPLMTMPSRSGARRAEGATRPGRKVEEDGAQPGALGEPSGTIL